MEEEIEKIREKYLKVRKLIDEDSKNDPGTDPFKSRLAAQPILLEMKDSLTEILDSSNLDDTRFMSYLGMLIIIIYEIGATFAETDDPSEAGKYFKEAIETIPDELSPEFIVIAIQSRNQYGIVLYDNDRKECENWLDEADRLYHNYKENYAGKAPKNYDDHFKAEDSYNGDKELARVHTLTKFYLAQVYGARKEFYKSAFSCYETLRMQSTSDKLDMNDFVLSSASLGQYFMDKRNFKQARYLMSVSSYMLDKYEESLAEMTISQEEIDDRIDEIRYRWADIARCWGKYGILLLEYSAELMKNPSKKVKEDTSKFLRFDKFDVSEYETQVTDREVTNFEEARQVFLFAQKKINEAKEYFTLEESASDHAHVVQDHSQLFRFLMSFEHDSVRRCQFLRRRIDMLEPIAKELNPKYYMPLCRSLWFEIGENYHNIMCIKYEKLRSTGVNTTRNAIKKINVLASSSINHFITFINSFRDECSKLPETFPVSSVTQIVLAHFYLGRMYYTYITFDKDKVTENTLKAYYYLKYVVEFCDRDERARDAVKVEYGISKPLLSVLKTKLLAK